MGATDKTFVDDSAPDLEAADLNGLNLEQKNLIEDSEQVFDDTDREQQSKAVSNLVAKGMFRGDSGAADAYVLEPTGNQKRVTALTNGQMFLFQVGNTNTGASTIAVDGLTAKGLKDLNGNALSASQISQDDYILIQYDSSNDYFIILVNFKNTEKIFTNTLTAYSGGGQANAIQLKLGESIITTVAATADSAKLPASCKVGDECIVINKGVSIMALFPGSGHNLGQGVDTSMNVPPDFKATLKCTVANSIWVLTGYESTVPLHFAYITLSDDQTTDLDIGDDVKFNTLTEGNMTISGASAYTVTLKKGKTYDLDFDLHMTFSNIGTTAHSIYDQTNAAYLEFSSADESSRTNTSHGTIQPRGRRIITPATDINVSVRRSGAGNYNSQIDKELTRFVVKQMVV